MTQEALTKRIEEYLSAGGLFNPELANHVAVRDLLIECREALREHAMREVQRLGQEIEQEPVAWMCKRDDGHFDVLTDQTCKKCFPVYTTPPQQGKEPVAYWKEHAQGLQRDYDSLLADFQAQRTWVDLTDEEIDELHGSPMNLEHSGALKWVRIIEAKLKEKNT
jgi:hypothetical protein